MEIHTEFQSNIITLVFETGKTVRLTKEESREFNKRMREVQEDARRN